LECRWKWNSTFGRAIPLREFEKWEKGWIRHSKEDWVYRLLHVVKREAILQVGLLNEEFFAYSRM